MKIWNVLLPAMLFLLGLQLLEQITWLETDLLKQMNQRTASTLQRLVQTKFFRIIRLNINQQCQLGIMNRICKSQSCTVCRCNDQDIPEFWSNTQKVKSHLSEGDLWALERPPNPEGQYANKQWVWHVQDQANDRGQYFDVHRNIESFTNYDGQSIWRLVYEQNCFTPNYPQTLCAQQKILYNVISGLHTSISTHLTLFYRHAPAPSLWADLSRDKDEGRFHFNRTEYKRRVLDHPERINNLFFLYRLLAKAVARASPYLKNNLTIASNDFAQDIEATGLLGRLLGELEGYELSEEEQEALRFFTPGNPMVKQYQMYIHNISDILNCVECEKCRLFGKMQTYGIGTALKILLGYPTPYKRNQIVALINVFNKISMSVNAYYTHRQQLISLGHQQISQKTKEIYKIVAGIICIAYMWRCHQQEFGNLAISAKKE